MLQYDFFQVFLGIHWTIYLRNRDVHTVTRRKQQVRNSLTVTLEFFNCRKDVSNEIRQEHGGWGATRSFSGAPFLLHKIRTFKKILSRTALRRRRAMSSKIHILNVIASEKWYFTSIAKACSSFKCFGKSALVHLSERSDSVSNEKGKTFHSKSVPIFFGTFFLVGILGRNDRDTLRIRIHSTNKS